MADHGDGNIKVVVRCRPLNSRELARGAKPLIRMQGKQTFLDPPEAGSSQEKARATERKTMAFSFDKSYWSAGPRDEPGYCSQQTLFDDLGKELLDHGFAGFNACILAWLGRWANWYALVNLHVNLADAALWLSGSGKSYSMMGYGPDKGIIPQTCSELFVRVENKKAMDANMSFTVEVSYIEIYNEKVRDLLNPKNTGNLRVREHPSLGPYVEDLSKLVVNSYDEMMTLMDEGNKARTVAATNMNETSSRSHAVFTLILTMKRHDVDTNLDTEKVSRISLVDLAGSERANSTGATGQRLKEGANINKSLTTLGKVISSLALASGGDGKKGGKKKADEFVPYRDSVLTWLLKDSLGGNSKTAMIAAISPADYEETLSTLRYADQAKKIKNKAVVNEDPNAKLVRELKEELEMLRARVSGGGGEDVFDPKIPPEKQKVTYQAKDGTIKTVTKAELQDQLETSEKLMQSLNETWEEKLERTQEVQKEREKALEELGITVEKNNVGVHTPKKMPHLVNLNEDPLMSECLIYQLRLGRITVGRMDSDKPVQIKLSGDNILEEHCYFENNDGKVTLHAVTDGITFLNGKQISPGQPYKLRSGFRIILGEHHVFRFNNPEEVRKQRDRATMRSTLQTSVTAADLEASGEGTRPHSPTASSAEMADVDWTYAKREAALARLGLDPALDSLPDEDLNKLYERITMVKTMRDHNQKPRPESSLSQADDVWSESGRPFSSDLTDDTSVDAGPSHGSPDVDGLKDAQSQLENQRQEFENRLQAISESTEAEDLKEEKDHMQHQLKIVQMQMKRLIDARARGETELEVEPFEPVIYSARQLRLIRKVLDKWRAHRSFSMAEIVLSNAVLVKEANVISRELGKDVTYNFTVASGGSLAAPTSSVNTIAGLDEFGDVADPVLASATQPSVAVKVLDKRHKAIYVWSLDRLQQQVQRMRNLTTFIDRPMYSQHFSSDEPFYNSPPPEFSFIGNAIISLAPLSRRLSSTSTVPIFCRYTAEAIGSCRVDIKLVNVVLKHHASGSTASTRSSSPVPNTLPAGSKISFFLTVDSVKGLSAHDFSAIHLQVRLSSFVGLNLKSEEIYHSTSVDLESSTPSELKFRRSFSIVATSKVLTHMKQGYAPIEFFASLRPQYLERMERWDEMREHKAYFPTRSGTPASDTRSISQPPSTPQPHAPFRDRLRNGTVARRCRLAADPRARSRRAVHPRARALAGQSRSRRIQPAPGPAAPARADGHIKLGASAAVDGGRARARGQHPPAGWQGPRARVVVEAARDARAAGGADERVQAGRLGLPLVRGAVGLERAQLAAAEPRHAVRAARAAPGDVDRRDRELQRPCPFLDGHGRVDADARRAPAVEDPRDAQLDAYTEQDEQRDLWRLDTSEKYVRGEEALGTWKARGISIVEDYSKLVTMENRAADVQAVRVILATTPYGAHTPQSGTAVWGSEEVLQKSLELWQKKFGHRGEIVLSQEPSETEESVKSAGKDDRESGEPLQLISTTKLVPRSDVPTKKGHLMILLDASQDVWERRWFVLRRPYLHVYKHSNELEEVSVISLNGVNVESNPEMETLLGKQYTFTLFTASNSHALAAPSLKELQSWTSKLDPTRALS
ncbi:hypothetical protein EVG20_g10118 [Dentipellis fragilis]|uniref:Kinesin-like protein n=1 Tax=Dentipellis fragilis TaxID=205917 RepID=A0A4Y9XVP0_9AGAM|nr:hypothetical protein EVG20_g10118 [Dentipellis fragilis]